MLWGDIIYVRRCLGLGGRPLDVYKFRTMAKDADKRHEEIESREFDAYGKPVGDVRVTSLGAIVRKALPN